MFPRLFCFPKSRINENGGKKTSIAFCQCLNGKKWSQILHVCFLHICQSQFWALSNYLQLKQTVFIFSFILLSKSSCRVCGTKSCMITVQIFHFKMAAMLQIPWVLLQKCKSSTMSSSQAKNRQQKSVNPALFPRMFPGVTTGMANEKCISEVQQWIQDTVRIET